MAAFRLAVASALVAAIISAQSTGSAPAAGAIAIGVCGAYGVAYDYERAAAASRAALGKCEGGCKVVPVSRACGAIAIDGRNACAAHGYAVAARLGEAQNMALRQCYQFGGKGCVIRAWACDVKG
jgi:Domain of unknown function (DUF4189)